MPIIYHRTLAQCRLINVKLGRLVIKNNYIRFDHTEEIYCIFCNELTYNSLYHLTMECSALNASRKLISNKNNSLIIDILNTSKINEISNLHKFFLKTIDIMEKNSNVINT